ncbi:MAG: hypothetical protein IPJ88_00890 [Myxococcales bacterium]|nr:MAG: hypothetical protein IPJ88_00890 [Myxococcales bacterium]
MNKLGLDASTGNTTQDLPYESIKIVEGAIAVSNEHESVTTRPPPPHTTPHRPPPPPPALPRDENSSPSIQRQLTAYDIPLEPSDSSPKDVPETEPFFPPQDIVEPEENTVSYAHSASITRPFVPHSDEPQVFVSRAQDEDFDLPEEKKNSKLTIVFSIVTVCSVIAAVMLYFYAPADGPNQPSVQATESTTPNKQVVIEASNIVDKKLEEREKREEDSKSEQIVIEQAQVTSSDSPEAQPQALVEKQDQDSTSTLSPTELSKLLRQANNQRYRNPERAIELYLKIIEFEPTEQRALTPLALVYYEAKDYKKAVEFAAQAVTADATNSKAWLTLGAARQSLGDRSGANEAYRLCASHGKGSLANECRRMLR